ncbi:MAG: hypothetical protein H3C47_01440 [Candidatus Cloacimonetes bacterium]|nr:hypothetical protein [Candidatus Cloacimonadota bacterium]
MNRCKPNQYIFSLFILFGALSPSWADWQSRFSTLMEALLYPITRRLPQNAVINETVPESPEDVLHRLRSILQDEKQTGQLKAEQFVALLEDGAIKTGLNLMEVYEELRHEFLPESSAALLEETLNLLPVNNPFSYLIAMDIWQHWKNHNFPDIKQELVETVISGDSVCKNIPQCMLGHARVLMKEGRFQEAKNSYKSAFSDPDSEFEYLNCNLFLALESRNRDEVNQKLTQLKVLFAKRDFQTQEKEIAFTFLDWEKITNIIGTGYRPQEHEIIKAVVALMWSGKFTEALEILKEHPAKAELPTELMLREFPNVGKTVLLTNLEPALQLDSIKSFSYSTRDLELLKGAVPENSPIYQHLFGNPDSHTHPPIDDVNDLVQLFGEIQSLNHSPEDIYSAFVEHPRLQEQNALQLALQAIGKQLPNSTELLARILLRLNSDELETYLEHTGLSPEDTAKGKALILSELSRTNEALLELKKVPGHKNSAHFYILELQAIRSNSEPDTLYQSVDTVLGRWPEFISHPLIVDILFEQGDFDAICRAHLNTDVPVHTWEQFVLSHFFTGKFKRAMELIDLKPTEMTLPPLPEANDISGFYHISLNLLNVLPDLAKKKQLQRFRHDLTPKIASDLMAESQSFSEEVQNILKELALKHKTE